jgi:hypothetical protein
MGNKDNDKRDFKCYTLVKIYNADCCQICGFIPCICKDIIGYDASTGLFIVKGDL